MCDSTDSLIERLTAERDKAREDAGNRKVQAGFHMAEARDLRLAARKHEKALEEAWDEGFTACAHQHMEQRRNPEHPITRTNPHQALGEKGR